MERVLAEPGVTDVLVNGTEGVWVDRGRGLERDTTRVGSATVGPDRSRRAPLFQPPEAAFLLLVIGA